MPISQITFQISFTMKTNFFPVLCSLLFVQMTICSQDLPLMDGQIKTYFNSSSQDGYSTTSTTNSAVVCEPPFYLSGLYNPSLPNDQNPAIFGDPLLKAELMSGGFFGKDKEYGDIDEDDDIDILYITNTHELWAIPNVGSLTAPDYRLSNRIFTGLTNVISFRLIDWSADAINDLIVMANPTGPVTVSLYIDINAQIGAPSPTAIFMNDTDFPINNGQLLEIGDIDGDGYPELLISGQGTAINGTASFKLVDTGWTLPPVYELTKQQSYQSPMISETGLSFPSPELYDADCDGDLDLFISDPTWIFEGGGHVDYYENTGLGSPLIYFTQVTPNPFGLSDIPLPNMDLSCDWVITRFVDFFGDGFPEAIAYNPCHPNSSNGEMFYYRNATEITSIVPISANENFSVYPNPVVDELSIDWSDAEIEKVSLSIVDYFGREQNVKEVGQNSGGIKLDVHLLSTGTYFVKVYSKRGLVKILKFVKV